MKIIIPGAKNRNLLYIYSALFRLACVVLVDKIVYISFFTANTTFDLKGPFPTEWVKSLEIKVSLIDVLKCGQCFINALLGSDA